MRMLRAKASETETVGDPTLAQKTGSYREPVLGLFFGAHGWTTSWPMVPLDAPRVRPTRCRKGMLSTNFCLAAAW